MVIRQPMAALLSLFQVSSIQGWAHPTGNMIAVGDLVLWSYISLVEDPFAPHWVALMGAECLLFSFRLDFTGESPKQDLVRYAPGGETSTIWEIPE